MRKELTYYRFDIERWLDENQDEFEWADSPTEYAEKAVKFHNSQRCKKRCQCIDENYEFVTPKLSKEDQKWFKEIAAERIAIKWGVLF